MKFSGTLVAPDFCWQTKLIRSQKKLGSIFVLFAIDGSFHLFVCRHNVEERQDVEVQGQVQQRADGVKKHVFAEEGVDQGQVQHVGQELSQPGPERDVDVERVLLLATFDDVGPQAAGGGCRVRHLDDSVEGDRVEDDLRNAEDDEVEEPLRGQAAAEDESAQDEFEAVDVYLEGPLVRFFAGRRSTASS